MFFDPIYFVFLLPAILLAGWAQLKVRSAFAKASEIRPASGMSGAEAARMILNAAGLDGVKIEAAQGFLGDHYDPRDKVLRLSQDVYGARSLAAVGVAAHEAGHALQDAQSYAPLAIRNAIVPTASIGSNLSWVLLMVGFMIQSFQLIAFGIALFSLVVVFQIVNLPVEYNASARAKELLVSRGIISPSERGAVSQVLDAAALTYVAATITAILTLLYYLYRAGLLGGNNRE